MDANYEITPRCGPNNGNCHHKQKCTGWCGSSLGYSWGWLASLILWFVIFLVLFWLVFYSLKPSFVMEPDTNQVDVSKVLIASAVVSLILIAVIFLIKMVVRKL